MNFCQTHWDLLKSHIEKYGLSKFIANDGKEAVDHLKRELENEATVVDFEPLLGAGFAASGLAMQYRGLYMMTPDENGKMPCPICSLRDYDWCEGAAYQMVIEAKRRGLIDEEPVH